MKDKYFLIELLSLIAGYLAASIYLNWHQFQWYRILVGGQWGNLKGKWMPLNDDFETKIMCCQEFEDWS